MQRHAVEGVGRSDQTETGRILVAAGAITETGTEIQTRQLGSFCLLVVDDGRLFLYISQPDGNIILQRVVYAALQIQASPGCAMAGTPSCDQQQTGYQALEYPDFHGPKVIESSIEPYDF